MPEYDNTRIVETLEAITADVESVEAGSVDTEKNVTELLERDYSDTFPTYPRQPEFDGAPSFVPHSEAKNPVLDGSEASDPKWEYAADPFIVKSDSKFYIFYELLNSTLDASTGEIGVASSVDGLTYTFEGTININGRVGHASPNVFKWGGNWYMTPDLSAENGDIELWRATSFPLDWDVDTTLVNTATDYKDPVTFRWGGKWWIHAASGGNGPIDYFYSDTLRSQFSPHDNNPVVPQSNDKYESPGGRPTVAQDWIDLPVQGSEGRTADNGFDVNWVRVTELTESSFTWGRVGSKPVLTGNESSDILTGDGWNSNRMHHMDWLPKNTGSDIVMVDGRSSSGWGVGVFRPSESLPITRLMIDGDISSGSFQDVPLNSDPVRYDARSNWDAANEKFIVNESGYYEVRGAIVIEQQTSGLPFELKYRLLEVGKTSSDRLASNGTVVNNKNNPQIVISYESYLTEGMELKMEVYQGKGSQVSTENLNDPPKSYWSVKRVR
jgi:hypothetical protein